MKFSLKNTLFIASLLSFTSAYAQNPTNTPTITNQQSAQVALMFVQNAQTAEITESKKHSGYYQLTLTGITPYITYFMQRPGRNSGIVPLQNFIKAWSVGPNNFKENNPNAVIIAAQINGIINKGTPPIVATLSNPEYQSNKSRLSFLIKPLHGQKLFYKEMSYENVTLIVE